MESNLIPVSGEIDKRKDFDKLIDSFLSSQQVKKNSKQTYKWGLRKFINWIEEKGIQNPTFEDILNYKALLESEGKSSLTVSNYLVAVRKFYEWAESKKLSLNIAKGIKGMKRSKGFRKDPLTVNQIKELLNSIDRSTEQGKRDYALLNLMIRTALRTIEIIRADIEDIRQESGEAVLWIQGKGRDSKDEFVLLTENTLNPINDYLSSRGKAEDKDPLFVSLSDRNKNKRLTTRSISRIVKEHLRNIGINSERLTAHSLRHTAITLSLLSGATLQEAQVLGRHSDINTTLVYAHNINRVANAPERKIDKLLAEAM